MADLTYPLPRDTVEALSRGWKDRSNPGLLFDRLCPVVGDGDRKDAGEAKRQALDRVRGCLPDGELLDAFRNRWRCVAAALGAVPFEASTASRLVVGLGRKGPLEVGFTFHRLYGFPIIPGSALKGLARAAALLERDGDPLDRELVVVFGREPDPRMGHGGCAGRAIFLDAIPAGPLGLELDIMNPHYPDYYRDKREAPTDWQNPNPVYFLAAGPGTPLLFAVGWRGDADRAVQARAVEWLRGGLGDLGVGAKTTSGYGYFVVDRDKATAPTRGVATAAEKLSADLPWRRAVVRVHRSGQGGTLVDAETGELITFSSGAGEPRGTTFKTKAEVEYRAVEREGRTQVVSVRRVQER